MNRGAALVRSVSVGDLRTEAIASIREAILMGRLKPGDRLNEQRLCDELGISRPPLREAIRSLEHSGLVYSVPRRGSFVRVLTGHDVEEIYAVRCALEGMAAELIIESSSEQEIDDLEQLVLKMETRGRGALPETIKMDLEFHRKLVMLSRNETLIGMWSQLASQLHLALTLVDPSFFEVEYIEATHRRLVTAIRAKEVEVTWKLIRDLREVGGYLRDRWEIAASAAAHVPPEPAASASQYSRGGSERGSVGMRGSHE